MIWLGLISLFILFFLLYFYLFWQPKNVFWSIKGWPEGTPDDWGISGWHQVDYQTPYGKCCAWWFPSDQKDAPTVVFCHGKGGNISHRRSTVELFKQLPMNFLLVDYHGFGKNPGPLSEKGCVEAVLGAVRALRNLTGIHPENMIIHGRSLGGGIAALSASKQQFRALILESTFTRLTDIAHDLYPWLPVKLLRYKFPTLDLLQKKINIPTLVIHSRTDDLIAPYHAEKLAACPSVTRLCWMDGGHRSGYRESAEYLTYLKEFLHEHKQSR